MKLRGCTCVRVSSASHLCFRLPPETRLRGDLFLKNLKVTLFP